MQINKENWKKFEKAMMPSPWLQRAIQRIHALDPYPTKEERRKILDEERKRG